MSAGVSRVVVGKKWSMSNSTINNKIICVSFKLWLNFANKLWLNFPESRVRKKMDYISYTQHWFVRKNI